RAAPQRQRRVRDGRPPQRRERGHRPGRDVRARAADPRTEDNDRECPERHRGHGRLLTDTMETTENMNRRVLVIDDNEAIQADFRKILTPTTAVSDDLLAAEAELFGEAPAA